jgi:hypothetical protein
MEFVPKPLLSAYYGNCNDYFNVLHLGPSHCITINHLLPSSVMRVYRIALHGHVQNVTADPVTPVQPLKMA